MICLKKRTVTALALATSLAALAACSDESEPTGGTSTGTATGTGTGTTTTGSGAEGGGGATASGGAGGSAGSGGVAQGGGTAGGGGSEGGNGSGGGSAAPGTYVLNGDSYTATSVSCASVPPYWGATAIETFSPRESFTLTFDAMPTAGTYTVVQTFAGYDPGPTEAGAAVIVDGDFAFQWFATGGGTVTVSDDGGKLHFEATNIPLSRQDVDGVGSINATCD